ncbi:MAG TPA: YkgJ family cysteine cluster protein [Paludibacter sp.]|nr:YkgJ family cysteine cluster protein [Paludibacter sp.]
MLEEKDLTYQRMEDIQIYKIIELKNYDVLIPFICWQCGSCCREYTPQIPSQNLPRIAQLLNKTIEEIKKKHEDAYIREPQGDCTFLNEGKCSIYMMRPEPCRIYPLFSDFGAAGVNCRGHKEFYRIVDSFFFRRRYAAMHDPKYFKRKIKRIPFSQIENVLKIVHRADVSDAAIKLFLELNNIQQNNTS